MVARGELTEGHARPLASDQDDRKRLAKRIVNEGHVRPRSRESGSGGRRSAAAACCAKVDPAMAERARAAAERLTGFPARVSAGKLEIHFGKRSSSRSSSRRGPLDRNFA